MTTNPKAKHKLRIRREPFIRALRVLYKLPSLKWSSSHLIQAIDHTFYGFIGLIAHAGCWENTRKACKSRAAGYLFRDQIWVLFFVENCMDVLHKKIFVLFISQPMKAENIYKAYVFTSVLSFLFVA